MAYTKKGKVVSKETREKMSESRQGQNNPMHGRRGESAPNWKGGISNNPYSTDWTKTLKKSIKERDHYICQLCYETEDLVVHHIDYNKKNCDPENLITLCRKCNIKVNYNRECWIEYFRMRRQNRAEISGSFSKIRRSICS